MKRARSEPSKVPNLGLQPPPQPMNLPDNRPSKVPKLGPPQPMNLPQELLDKIALQSGIRAPTYTKIFRSTPSVVKKAEKIAKEKFEKDDPRSDYAYELRMQMEKDMGHPGAQSDADLQMEDVFDNAPDWAHDLNESYF